MSQPPDGSPPPSEQTQQVRPFLDFLGENLFPGNHLLPQATLAQIAETYDYTLRARGPTAKSVLWRSRLSQWWRFRLLLAIMTGEERRTPGLVVNDFGCGYGALYRMIRRKRFMRGGAYYGYDLCPAMVRTARLTAPAPRAHQPSATFIDADRVGYQADFSFCSGTFGLRMETPPAVWRTYVQETLRHLACYSRRGLAFNLLNIRDPNQRETLYYADPEDYITFCRAELSPHVTLHEGPFKALDFTVHVRF
jgi:SAM-dependent methyltransferase